MSVSKRGMRIADVAREIDRSVQMTYEITRKRDFPAPCEVVGIVKFWSAGDVKNWLARNRRMRRVGPHKHTHI